MPQLAPFTIVAPGSLGLATERADTLLPQGWALEATNCVVNEAGRLAARRGWQSQTSTALGATIQQIHEYVKSDGSVEDIVATSTAIYGQVANPASTVLTPTTTPTAGNWQFVNFNGNVYGWQASHTPIVYTGSGTFTDLAAASGTVPAGNACVAAFGRIWAVNADKQSLQYCALLDATRWDAADGGGAIDMRSVWTNGTDEIVAVAALGAALIVFGRNHIVQWISRSGSELGLVPTDLYVVDTIEGTGCISRDSVSTIGEGDMFYLSRHGVQSLGRVIQSKSSPIVTLTRNVQSDLQALIASETSIGDVRAVHHAEENFYVISFPASRKAYVLDTRSFIQDLDGFPVPRITCWTHLEAIRSLVSKNSGEFYMAFGGRVGQYGGTSDNNAAFTATFSTGFLDMGPQVENRLKMLKEINTTVTLGITGSLTWLWQWDFEGDTFRKTVNYSRSAVSEWGVAEFGIGEFTGGVRIQRRRFDGRGEGQYLRIGFSLPVSAGIFELQQITLYGKLGRMT